MRPRLGPSMVSILLAATLTCGCDRGKKVEQAEPVVALVAASTKDAVQVVAAAFKTAAHGDVKINADDSSKLATQIVQDAPAHVFLSANEKWADFVEEKGYAKEIVPLLGNSLVVVVPEGNPAKIAKAEDLLNPEFKRLALAGPTVPAGIYARQALKKLNLWDGLEAGKKVASGENVRVALTYVERGEAEAGIVYTTDAQISSKVKIAFTFPADLHEPIRYPLVLLKSETKAARDFFVYLSGPQAKEIFARHGFTLLDGK